MPRQVPAAVIIALPNRTWMFFQLISRATLGGRETFPTFHDFEWSDNGYTTDSSDCTEGTPHHRPDRRRCGPQQQLWGILRPVGQFLCLRGLGRLVLLLAVEFGGTLDRECHQAPLPQGL